MFNDITHMSSYKLVQTNAITSFKVNIVIREDK